jgi:hypothetical protein
MSVSGLPPALASSFSGGANGNGPPSPSLPDIPSHPTLDSLIDATLNAGGAPGNGPRIGDPGKRMLGHALGMRHPSLPTRNGSNVSPPRNNLPLAMGGLTIAE